jgi:hypothetical protein
LFYLTLTGNSLLEKVDKKILHNGSFCALGGKERRVSFFTFVLSKIRESNVIDAAFVHAGV